MFRTPLHRSVARSPNLERPPASFCSVDPARLRGDVSDRLGHSTAPNVERERTELKRRLNELEDSLKPFHALPDKVRFLEDKVRVLERENKICKLKCKELEDGLEKLSENFGTKVVSDGEMVYSMGKVFGQLNDLQALRGVGLRKFLELSRAKILNFCGLSNWNQRCTPKEWQCFIETVHSNSNLLTRLQHEGLTFDTLQLLTYGLGSSENQLSKAAHLERLVSSQSLGPGCTDREQARSFSKCIAVCEDKNHRKEMDKLFKFCFKMGTYLSHLD